jgi:peptide-methionine (R)-S-oxide reductase
MTAMPGSSSRRQWLAVLASACGLAPLVVWLSASSAPGGSEAEPFPVRKSDEEWRRLLPRDRYRVLRGHATERAFTSPLNHEHRRGVFTCAGCGHPLFDSATKFDSGTGWPSFVEPLPKAVGTRVDRSWLMVRTEVHCARCGGHLGHVFGDGPPPTGLRYCINGLAIDFVETPGRTS